jgi:hypothetical protein
MFFDDPTQPFRVVNLILATVALIWLVHRRWKNSDLYVGFRQDVWLLAIYWTVSSIVHSVEQLLETGTSIRILFAFLALLTTLRLLGREKDWVGIRKGADPNEQPL